MRVPCFLREIRGSRAIRDLADASGVHRGTLSQIENGRLLPAEKQVDGIARAYGAEPETWYPPHVLLAIERTEVE